MNEEVFDSLEASKKALAIWRHDYNSVRPLPALSGISPAAARGSSELCGGQRRIRGS